MSLVKRKIRTTIILGTGAFGESAAGASNTVTLEGYRTSANITKGGLPGLDSAVVRIFGVSRGLMNQLTRIGTPYTTVRNNSITVEAGDDDAGMSQVFAGTITNSYGDFDGAPDAALDVTALAGGIGLAKPVAPLSFPGGADVAVILAQIAASLGQSFQNWGVTGRILSDSYVPGTAIDQLRAIAKAANIHAAPYGGPNGQTLEIWPMDGTRGGRVPDIGPGKGLVGYPRYSDLGVALTTVFTPGLAYGGALNLDTSVVPARGLWNILRLSYELESETPGGAWFSHIDAIRPPSAGGAQVL